MDAPDTSRDTARLHVSTLLVASERALTNALDELGFAEDDDRVIEHEGRLAFVTCSHDTDCDDLFTLVAELGTRGETWELQFRVDTGEGRAIFQRLARHLPVEAIDAVLPPEASPATEELPLHDLETEPGRKALRKALTRIDPAEVFVTIGSNQAGRASATVMRRAPRAAIAMAQGADEASLRGAIREILPTVMFSVAMKPG
jgi:hypothetical protein